MEKCPLEAGQMKIDSIPEFCMSHCGSRWEEALRTQIGDMDWYGAEGCNHDAHEVDFSHDALQRTDTTNERLYSIVDMCAGCQQELMETAYSFRCPYST
jgi:hypothetical protein